MRTQALYGLIAALGLISLPAAAADNGIYIGASVGLSGIEEDDLDYDIDSTGYKIIAGWRFLDWLAVEGNYIDFGSGDDDVLGETIETSADALSLSAVAFLPIGPLDLFARVGVIDWDAEVSTETLGSFGDSGTDLTYGIGAQFRIWSISVRAEYEIFDLDGTDADMLSAGITYTFF